MGLARCMLQHIPLDAGGAVSLQRAVLHGAAGELDEAFRHLDRALDLPIPGWVTLLSRRSGTACATIRGSPNG